MPYFVNTLLRIDNILILLGIVCFQNSRYVLLDVAAPVLEIPYSVCSFPTTNPLIPIPDALLGIV